MDYYFYGKRPCIDNLSFIDYPSNNHCLTIFFTGCSWNCEGCQNVELQKTGKVYDKIGFDEFVQEVRDVCKRLHTNKIALQGGSPLHPQNRDFTKKLLDELHNEFDFIVYTGYSYDAIKDYVQNAKFVKTGNFEIDKFVGSYKTDKEIQFATTNQKLYYKGELVSENGKYRFEN